MLAVTIAREETNARDIEAVESRALGKQIKCKGSGRESSLG